MDNQELLKFIGSDRLTVAEAMRKIDGNTCGILFLTDIAWIFGITSIARNTRKQQKDTTIRILRIQNRGGCFFFRILRFLSVVCGALSVCSMAAASPLFLLRVFALEYASDCTCQEDTEACAKANLYGRAVTVTGLRDRRYG